VAKAGKMALQKLDKLRFLLKHSAGAFTLIELLVVCSVISLLLAILTPALSAVKSTVRATICKSNLHQLVIANVTYSEANDGFYVPAASDMWDNSGLHRWHGVRKNLNSPFDPLKGPLAAYLSDGRIKNCPQKTGFAGPAEWAKNFEQGCGGYGYNMTYIGSRLWQETDYKIAYPNTTNASQLHRPQQCLMFADTAISVQQGIYIEYSFAEPPFTVYDSKPVTSFYMSPSIHFRHSGYANVGWADGHADQHRKADTCGSNAYGVNSTNMKLGWFEPLDNSMFDLE
jgi:prepilin-type processing-associated H-X9-DG protein